MTSHDVVSRVRRAARTRRVGHAGTLDPFATGLLLVCVGFATRLMQFLIGHDKEYIATVRLGFATDTQDLTGKQITPLHTSNEVSEDEVRETLIEMIGPQLQVPPMFSAKKIGGERLYKAAREGRQVARDPVAITVHSMELLTKSDSWMRENADGTCDFDIRVRCSSGTYVRTLAHDLGDRLSTGAHLAALRRTVLGQFDIADAISLDDLQSFGEEGRLSDKMISLVDTVSHLELVELDDERARLVLNGRQIELSESDRPDSFDEPIRLCDSHGSLIAIGEIDDARKVVKPRVVFNVES